MTRVASLESFARTTPDRDGVRLSATQEPFSSAVGFALSLGVDQNVVFFAPVGQLSTICCG